MDQSGKCGMKGTKGGDAGNSEVRGVSKSDEVQSKKGADVQVTGRRVPAWLIVLQGQEGWSCRSDKVKEAIEGHERRHQGASRGHIRGLPRGMKEALRGMKQCIEGHKKLTIIIVGILTLGQTTMTSLIRGVAVSRHGHASPSATEYRTNQGWPGRVGRSLGMLTCSKSM
eukprot:50240-Pelagomonas_calceolata.AAC.2